MNENEETGSCLQIGTFLDLDEILKTKTKEEFKENSLLKVFFIV